MSSLSVCYVDLMVLKYALHYPRVAPSTCSASIIRSSPTFPPSRAISDRAWFSSFSRTPSVYSKDRVLVLRYSTTGDFRVGVVGRCFRMSVPRCFGKGRRNEIGIPPRSKKRDTVPRIRVSDWSAHTPCRIGKENLPSVRSSAKPFVFEYYAKRQIIYKS